MAMMELVKEVQETGQMPPAHVHAAATRSTLTCQPRRSQASASPARSRETRRRLASQAMIDPCAAHFTLHSASPLTPTLHVRPADRPQRRK